MFLQKRPTLWILWEGGLRLSGFLSTIDETWRQPEEVLV